MKKIFLVFLLTAPLVFANTKKRKNVSNQRVKKTFKEIERKLRLYGKKESDFFASFPSRVVTLEPYIGQASMSLTATGNASGSDDLSGIKSSSYSIMGAQLLMSFSNVFGGFDFFTSSPSLDTSSTSENFPESESTTSYKGVGLVFGTYFKNKIRLGLTLYPVKRFAVNEFSYRFQYEDPNDFSIKQKTVNDKMIFVGSGFKLQASAQVFKRLTVSANYLYSTFRRDKARTVSTDDPNTPLGSFLSMPMRIRTSSIYLSLSYPFNFDFLRNI